MPPRLLRPVSTLRPPPVAVPVEPQTVPRMPSIAPLQDGPLRREIRAERTMAVGSSNSHGIGRAPNTMNTEQWTEKYRPQTIEQILGNDQNLQTVLQWFADFHAHRPDIKRALLFSGPPGLGKTSMAHCLLRHFNYRVREFNASDIRSKKLVEANLHDMVDIGYVDRLYSEDYQRFGIIMDEVDGMSTGDKGGMAELIRFINPNRGKRSVRKEDLEEAHKRWIPPIICICNTTDKKIKDLKKDCLEIRFQKPTAVHMLPLVHRIMAGEQLQITPAAQTAIAEMSQGDYRRLVYICQNLAQMFAGRGEHMISEADVTGSATVLTRKAVDPVLINTTERLLNDRVNCAETLYLYESDKSLLPMMIHENYLLAVNNLKQPLPVKFEVLRHCLQNICLGDMIDKTMYNTQSWYLQPVHGLCSCFVPADYLTRKARYGAVPVRFTTALSKFSSHCSNQKNLNVIQALIQHRNAYSNPDLHHFSAILLDLLLDEPVTSRLTDSLGLGLEQITTEVTALHNKVEGPAQTSGSNQSSTASSASTALPNSLAIPSKEAANAALRGRGRTAPPPETSDPRAILGVKFLLNYGLNVKDLEKLNKMDKLNVKRQYSSKLKTHLGKVYQKAVDERNLTKVRIKPMQSFLDGSPIKWPTAFKNVPKDPRIANNDPPPKPVAANVSAPSRRDKDYDDDNSRDSDGESSTEIETEPSHDSNEDYE